MATDPTKIDPEVLARDLDRCRADHGYPDPRTLPFGSLNVADRRRLGLLPTTR